MHLCVARVKSTGVVSNLFHSFTSIGEHWSERDCRSDLSVKGAVGDTCVGIHKKCFMVEVCVRVTTLFFLSPPWSLWLPKNKEKIASAKFSFQTLILFFGIYMIVCVDVSRL